MLPVPRPRSRNFMQGSYIVWLRDLTSVSRIQSRKATLPDPIHNVECEGATPKIQNVLSYASVLCWMVVAERFASSACSHTETFRN